VVKNEQTPFVNRKADGRPETKATKGSENIHQNQTYLYKIKFSNITIQLFNRILTRMWKRY